MIVYRIWDIINLLCIAAPLFFLMFELHRTGTRTVRIWMFSLLLVAFNYALSFTGVYDLLPRVAHMASNLLVFACVCYAVINEVLPPKPFRSKVFRVSFVVFLAAMPVAGLLPKGLHGRVSVIFGALMVVTLVFTFWQMRAVARRYRRFSLYMFLLTLCFSYVAYDPILLFQVLFRISSTVAFLIAFFVVGGTFQKITAQLEKRSANLVLERDIILTVMQSIGREIRSISEVNQTLEIILRQAMDALHAQAGAIYLIDKETSKLNAVVVEGYFPPLFKMPEYATTRKEHIARLMKKHKITVGDGLIGNVAKELESVLVRDGSLDPRITQYGKDAASINTLMASPLRIKDDLLGVIAVVNKDSGESFGRHELDLFNSLAIQTAITINNARMYANLADQERMKRELEFAKRIQQNMLPKTVPEVNGIQLAGDMMPALEVGGDYYDFIKRSDDRVNMVIGDVSGKGIPAGMIMLMIRTILHAVSGTFKTTKEVVCAASKLMLTNLHAGEFMTLIYLDWDNRSRTMTYTSAGHEQIVIYRADKKECENIISGGIAIGMHDEIEQFVEEKTFTADTGDVMVLYTDGITEAFNAAGEMYGLDRLMELMKNNASGRSAEDIKNILIEDIRKFTGDTQQHDDITSIVAKIT